MNTTPAAPTTTRRQAHWALAVLTVVYAMNLIDRQIMGVLIEPVKNEFGASDTMMGFLTGLAFAAFYSALAIPFARYADRANRRNFVAWCCMGWSVMTGLCGMALNFTQLALARMGVAVGEAGGSAPSLSMIADLYPRAQRSRAMSVYMLGPHMGTLFGLGAGAWIAHQYGWRTAFIVMAVPGILAALLLRWTCVEPLRGTWDAPEAQQAESAQPKQPLREILLEVWRTPGFAWIAVAGMLFGLAGYGLGIWGTAFLVRTHGLNLRDAGILVGLTGGVAAVIGALLSGWLTDKLVARDPRWQMGVPIVGTAIAIPLGMAYLLWPAGDVWQIGALKVPVAMGFSLLFSVFAVWWTAPSYAAITTLVGASRRATSVAVYNLGLTVCGIGLGPFSVGVLSDLLTPAYGPLALRWALVIVMGGFVLAMVALILAARPYARALAKAG
jgi:predicted MFS family arabinose efflux permease